MARKGALGWSPKLYVLVLATHLPCPPAGSLQVAVSLPPKGGTTCMTASEHPVGPACRVKSCSATFWWQATHHLQLLSGKGGYSGKGSHSDFWSYSPSHWTWENRRLCWCPGGCYIGDGRHVQSDNGVVRNKQRNILLTNRSGLLQILIACGSGIAEKVVFVLPVRLLTCKLVGFVETLN